MKSLRARLMVGSTIWMFVVIIAVDAAVLMSIHRRWSRNSVHHSALAIVAVGFTIGGWLLLRRALVPLRDLRDRLARVRRGEAVRVEGVYPSEIEPLVSDLNALLDDRERAVKRALATAGDLAHGLKTPLAILAHEGERNVTISQQVERMRRQVDYHLAHARATASAGVAPGLRCLVLPSVEGLVRTMLRLHADRGVAIDMYVSPEHAIRGKREDLDEMLGNLIDNACKWARSQVVIESYADEKTITILVDDDGAGLDPAMRDAVLQRGVRADEALPGSGLGLAIVRDLAELYGGAIALDASPSGGVRARLELPAA